MEAILVFPKFQVVIPRAVREAVGIYPGPLSLEAAGVDDAHDTCESRTCCLEQHALVRRDICGPRAKKRG